MTHSVATSPASAIRSFHIEGPVGRLEALLNSGRDGAPYAALVCHPNPMGGGTMHNKVVYNAMKVFSGFGLPVLRFNFRGTGSSEGVHDHGRSEQDDVRAALDWLDREFHLPVLFAGFSFGSNVGMRACCGDGRVRGLVALGLPVEAEGHRYSYKYLPSCPQPKLFISGDRDIYGPRELVEQVVATAPHPKELVFVPGADHFFVGKLQQMQAFMRDWLQGNFQLGAL